MSKYPVLSTERRSKKNFDSADHFMQKEKERSQEKCSEEPVEIQVPECYKDRVPVLHAGRVAMKKKKAFDSAEYFMEKHVEKRKNENQPEAGNDIVVLPKGREPMIKRGKTEKKPFDSADYFMDQDKLKRIA